MEALIAEAVLEIGSALFKARAARKASSWRTVAPQRPLRASSPTPSLPTAALPPLPPLAPPHDDPWPVVIVGLVVGLAAGLAALVALHP